MAQVLPLLIETFLNADFLLTGETKIFATSLVAGIRNYF